jgi:hypothetical protein
MSNENRADALAMRKNAEAAIVKRAWSDPTFRANLLKDPKGTLEKAGVRFPNGATVVIHEEAANTFHYVLPQVPSTSGELSEAELETVSGGPIYMSFSWG